MGGSGLLKDLRPLLPRADGFPQLWHPARASGCRDVQIVLNLFFQHEITERLVKNDTINRKTMGH